MVSLQAEKQAELEQMGEGEENASQGDMDGEEHSDDEQRDYEGNLDEETEEM